jgi:hypothetical protein
MKRSHAIPVRNAGAGARAKEDLDRIYVVRLHGPVQGRRAVRGRRINLSALLHESPHGGAVASLDGFD